MAEPWLTCWQITLANWSKREPRFCLDCGVLQIEAHLPCDKKLKKERLAARAACNLA